MRKPLRVLLICLVMASSALASDVLASKTSSAYGALQLLDSSPSTPRSIDGTSDANLNLIISQSSKEVANPKSAYPWQDNDKNLNHLLERGGKSTFDQQLEKIIQENEASPAISHAYKNLGTLNDFNLKDPKPPFEATRTASNLKYLYEKDSSNVVSLKHPDGFKNADVGQNYLYKKTEILHSIDFLIADTPATSVSMVDPNLGADLKKIRDSYVASELNLNNFDKNLQASEKPSKDQKMLFSNIEDKLKILAMEELPLPYPFFDLKLKSSNTRHEYHKNYAIVVGINEYTDRLGLSNCVNDADKITSLLELYGYEVIKLTDKTAYKPTKHNILDGALEEIELKQDKGNVIFYFSGHGDFDDKGNYYLIPQDANGASTSYISEEELRQHIGDINNLAIIIDACSSGALCNIASDKQLLLASSKRNESSNEEWTGSLSVFTYNLISAIQEEDQKDNRILLQRCFYKALNNTVRWSNGHMIGQTPILFDTTPSKKYYLT